MNENIAETLEKLALAIRKTIQEGISNGEFQAENERVFCWKIKNFRYTDAGTTYSQAQGDYSTRKNWFRASAKALEKIKQTEPYSSSIKLLRKTFEDKVKYNSNLQAFASRVIYSCFYDSPTKKENINSLIAIFLKQLKGKRPKYGVEAELHGIVLRPDKIELDYGVTLRQPRIEDLEKETRTFSSMGSSPFPPKPSAYVRIECLEGGAGDAQIRVEHAITMLRLFRVGSVNYSSHRTYSDFGTNIEMRGGGRASIRGIAREKYLVRVEDIVKLKKFWKRVAKRLPSTLFGFDQTKADHLTIAYTRYSDALLQNGIIERRIANAIMGMESLYLKGEETQEIGYRLRVRVGKIFQMLELDDDKVRRNLGDAYRMRSLFVHGSQLSQKEKTKLELKHKDLKNLLVTVLDYLRISIIVWILLKKGKEEFIDMLDDALVDNKKEKQLGLWLSATKDVIK